MIFVCQNKIKFSCVGHCEQFPKRCCFMAYMFNQSLFCLFLLFDNGVRSYIQRILSALFKSCHSKWCEFKSRRKLILFWTENVKAKQIIKSCWLWISQTLSHHPSLSSITSGFVRKKSLFQTVSFCCIPLIMISITTVIQYIHKYKYRRKQANSIVSDTKGLFISSFGPWRHEEWGTILTMLTPSRCAAHLVVFKISIHLCWSRPEKLNRRRNGRKLNSMPQWQKLNFLPQWSNLNSFFFFQNPQILRTISSGYDVIHTPAPFPVGGFIMTMVIVTSFVSENKTATNDYAPELKRLE